MNFVRLILLCLCLSVMAPSVSYAKSKVAKAAKRDLASKKKNKKKKSPARHVNSKKKKDKKPAAFKRRKSKKK